MNILKILNICGKDYDRIIEDMDEVKIVSKKRYGFKNGLVTTAQLIKLPLAQFLTVGTVSDKIAVLPRRQYLGKQYLEAVL